MILALTAKKKIGFINGKTGTLVEHPSSRLVQCPISKAQCEQLLAYLNTSSGSSDKHQAATISNGDGVPSLMTGVASVASSIGVLASVDFELQGNAYSSSGIDTFVAPTIIPNTTGQQPNNGAGQQSKEMVCSITNSNTSIAASSLVDKVSHNNSSKQLCSNNSTEMSDTEHQWACKDVLETIEAVPYHEIFIRSFGDYDTRGL
nr:hypothetical protein CFP56_61287 [Quercus suber]